MLHVVNMPLQACYSWFIAVIANHLLLRYRFSSSACTYVTVSTSVYSSIRARCDRVGETLLDTKNCCAKIWPCLVHVHCVTTYPSCPLLRWAHYCHTYLGWLHHRNANFWKSKVFTFLNFYGPKICDFNFTFLNGYGCKNILWVVDFVGHLFMMLITS